MIDYKQIFFIIFIKYKINSIDNMKIYGINTSKYTLNAACFISAKTLGSRWTLLLLLVSDWECNISASVGISWLEMDANLWRSVFTSVRYAIVSAATTRSSQEWSFLQRTT